MQGCCRQPSFDSQKTHTSREAGGGVAFPANESTGKSLVRENQRSIKLNMGAPTRTLD